jgi:hypothetical protein
MDANIHATKGRSDAEPVAYSLEAHSTEARALGDAEGGSVSPASDKSGTGNAHSSSREMSPISLGDEHHIATPHSRNGMERAKPLGFVSFGSHPDVKQAPFLCAQAYVVSHHPSPSPHARRSFRTLLLTAALASLNWTPAWRILQHTKQRTRMTILTFDL